MDPGFELSNYFPILIFLAVLIGFCISVMIMAHTLGPWRRTAVKQMTYESGMDPIGDAHQRFDVKYYLVAIMFLVFDVELLFLYPWAVVAYEEGGYPALLAERHVIFWAVLTFIVLLLVAYLYDWKKGVFRWRESFPKACC